MRRVKASVGRTVSTGEPYEFYRVDLGEEIDLPDGIDLEVAFDKLVESLTAKVDEKCKDNVKVKEGRLRGRR